MKLPPALRGIDIPAHVVIETRSDFQSLLQEVMSRSVGFDGFTLFGSAFKQGERLQFTCSMPLKQMLDLSTQDRAPRGANVLEVLQHSNRPGTQSHEKHIREYLQSTACIGAKWVLPSFTLNFGVKVTDDTPDVTVILLDHGKEGQVTWPAVVSFPRGARTDMTDGVHRRNTIGDMVLDKKADPDGIITMMSNAVDVKIVFESNQSDSHQDFADCGRTKPISRSTLTAYDVRETHNAMATVLATRHPFLLEYVDGSANNVNLSVASHKIWSLSALRTAVKHIVDNYPHAIAKDDRVKDLPLFFDELVKYLPQFKQLEEHRTTTPRPNSITPELRDQRGGDVALRAMGLFIFARAYLYCAQKNVSFETMAKKLAEVDWCALNIDRHELDRTDPETYHTSVLAHANPLWRAVLVINPNRYKVSASNKDATLCWDLIVQQHIEAAQQVAA